MQFVKLADLARQALYEDGEQTEHKFAKANYFAVQIAKQLNLHLVRAIQPARLTVRANKTAVLPPDFAGLHAVFLARGQELVTLTAFSRLALDRPGDATGSPIAQPVTTDHFRADCVGEYVEMGGAGGYNAAGHYRLDLAGGQLLLAADVPEDATIYLEYLGSGIAASGTAQVPLYVEQVVLSYIAWKMLPKSASRGDKQDALAEHKRQMLIAQRFKNLTTRKQILEVTSEHYSKTVR
jgi:hypothetical protein